MQAKEAKGVLFVVSGDAFSRRVEEIAKGAGFQVTIIRLDPQEASAQTVPLPMLLIAGHSYGPASVYQFLESEAAP